MIAGLATLVLGGIAMSRSRRVGKSEVEINQRDGAELERSDDADSSVPHS